MNETYTATPLSLVHGFSLTNPYPPINGNRPLPLYTVGATRVTQVSARAVRCRETSNPHAGRRSLGPAARVAPLGVLGALGARAARAATCTATVHAGPLGRSARSLALAGGVGLLVVVVVVVVVVVDGRVGREALLAELREAHALRLHDGHALAHLVGRLDEELVQEGARAQAERERADDGDPRPRALGPVVVLVLADPLLAAAQLTAVAGDRLAQLAPDRVTHVHRQVGDRPVARADGRGAGGDARQPAHLPARSLARAEGVRRGGVLGRGGEAVPHARPVRVDDRVAVRLHRHLLVGHQPRLGADVRDPVHGEGRGGRLPVRQDVGAPDGELGHLAAGLAVVVGVEQALLRAVDDVAEEAGVRRGAEGEELGEGLLARREQHDARVEVRVVQRLLGGEAAHALEGGVDGAGQHRVRVKVHDALVLGYLPQA